MGYAAYSNTSTIIDKFYKEKPWLDLGDTIFKKSIEPALQTKKEIRLLYLKNQHDTEASIRLSRLVKQFNMLITISDPRESTVQTLTWYVENIWCSPGIIVHLSGKSRHGSHLHNSRYSFVSGLAFGFQKSLLMLAESDFQSPIDYSDILCKYNTPAECTKIAKDWIENVSEIYSENKKKSTDYAKKIALSADLKSFNVGEYVAENEEEALEEYFITPLGAEYHGFTHG